MGKNQGRANKLDILLGSIIGHLARIKRWIRHSVGSWQKLRDYQLLFSCGTLASLIYVGNTVQHRRSGVGSLWSVWKIAGKRVYQERC